MMDITKPSVSSGKERKCIQVYLPNMFYVQTHLSEINSEV